MTACLDWETRLRKGQRLVPPPKYPSKLARTEAQKAVEYLGRLRIADMADAPPLRDVARPWMIHLAEALFGSYDPDKGTRTLRELFILVAKKNAKSTLAAAIMLTAIIRNWRESAEFIILAPTKEIANNSFGPARDMIRKNEKLSAIFHVQSHTRKITHRVTEATLQIIAAEEESVSGKKASGVLIEELWLFGKRPNAESMLREATGGLISRPEGFVIYLTTQSDEPPAGVFAQKLRYARDVRDGIIDDPAFLPVLYEPPESALDDGKPRDFDECLRFANPNLGASVDLEYLRREHSKAKQAGVEAVAGFYAKHMNLEIGLRLRSDRWTGADFWERNGDKSLRSLDDLLARSDVVVCGIDGGGLDDLLGVAVLGRDGATGVWLVYTHAWAHPIVLERNKDVATRLRDLVAAREVTIVKQPGDDVQAVANLIQKVAKAGLLPDKNAIGVDAVGIVDIVDELVTPERGIKLDQIVTVPQGWRLNGAVKTVERKLAAGEIQHGGGGLMAFAVGNARIETRGNAIMVTKAASGTAKIDPLMALFNAVSLMALNPAGARRRYQMFVIGGREAQHA